MIEKLDVKQLRKEAVDRARERLRAARTTKERHYARLGLQRARRENGE